jgi:hypothetical protein
MNPDNARGTRITEASGTSLATPYSSATVTPPSKPYVSVSSVLHTAQRAGFIAEKSFLHPEGLLQARGVASSGFRPLRIILDCCLP